MIAVGDELLDGRVRDRNAWSLGARARAAGAALVEVSVVADVEAEIVAAIRRAANAADHVVVSGGLGPTPDDRTRDAAAEASGVQLVTDDSAIERLRERYAGRGRGLDDASLRQAKLPVGATVHLNPIGTADAFTVTVDGTPVTCLPGVPSEFDRLLDEIPGLAPKQACDPGTSAAYLALVGLFESEAASRVRDAIGAEADAVTWRAALPIVEVGIGGLSSEAADAVRETLAPWTLPAGCMHPAEALGTLAVTAGARVTTAESCTGGRVASWITDVPGASRWFDAGFVTYANAAKEGLLDVPADVLVDHGAVSEPVARAMARGARARARADVAVALTGVAGPGGGTPDKPVGTVWIACATRERVHAAHAWFARRDRSTFKSLAATLALRMAAEALDPRIDPALFRGVQAYHRGDASR